MTNSRSHVCLRLHLHDLDAGLRGCGAPDPNTPALLTFLGLSPCGRAAITPVRGNQSELVRPTFTVACTTNDGTLKILAISRTWILSLQVGFRLPNPHSLFPHQSLDKLLGGKGMCSFGRCTAAGSHGG